MEDYLLFLTDATKSKLSLSEYLYIRIYQEDKSKDADKKISERDTTIKNLEAENKKLTDKLHLKAQDEKKANSQTNSLHNRIKEHESKINQLNTENKKLQTEVARLTGILVDKNKDLEKYKSEVVAIQKRSEKVIADHQKFVSDNIGYMEQLAKQKKREFLPEVQEVMNKLKT